MGAPLRAKRRIDADRIRSLIAATAAGMVAATALNLMAVRWVMRRGAQVLWDESW